MSSFTLPPLPYRNDAFEPTLSSKTFDFHHGKHHQGYVNNLNTLLDADASYQGLMLEQVIETSYKSHSGIFNNAAQIWNHAFFWHSLNPSPSYPSTTLAQEICTSFGSLDAFKSLFHQAALAQFGSGWAWLVRKPQGELSIVTTANGDVPWLVTPGVIPLLTLDVWEHAYYLDYQNRRGDYIKALIDSHLNWGFAKKAYENNTLLTLRALSQGLQEE